MLEAVRAPARVERAGRVIVWMAGGRMRDAARRATVMARSRAIGHCICDVRKPCPCPDLLERDLCPCAGERPEEDGAPIRLTRHVKAAGCAGKIGKADLERLLSGLPDLPDPRVLVGRHSGDDAGVMRLGPGHDTVFTVDVFPPPVDDPASFGRIATANSLSDVWAMGGRPQAALAIVGWPLSILPGSGMRAMLDAAFRSLAEAGVPCIGGHSIASDEPLAGFAVIGAVPPGEAKTNAGARAGDLLVLSKPIGGGLQVFANAVGRADPQAFATVVAAMEAMNRAAGEALIPCRASAATDITGFSLLGHLGELTRQSGVAAELWWDAIPVFPGSLDLARAGVIPGAVERNREAIDPDRVDLSALDAAQQAVLLSPETSGGILAVLPPDALADYQARVPGAVVIGRVASAIAGGRIDILPRRSAMADCCCPPAAPVPVPVAPAATLADPLAAWRGYMAQVLAPGAIDARQKRLIAYALAHATRCQPCVASQAAAARAAGASEAELAEAAALGIAFGGAAAGAFAQGLTG
jgi:selenide,water dikinase